MTRKRRKWLAVLGVLSALVFIQGVRHRWHLLGAQGIKDCRTGEVIYDGCGMFEIICAKCGFECAEGTAPPGEPPIARCD